MSDTTRNGDCSFFLSGYVERTIREGNWPEDCPSGYAAIRAGERRKAGKGSRIAVTMAYEDAIDLAYYLESVASLWEDMTTEERSGDDPRPIRRAVVAIRAAADNGSSEVES